MALELNQQLEEILKKSKNVLILLPQNPDGDAIGSGWALNFFLEKTESQITVAFADELKELEKFVFLPQPKNVTHSISGARDFILSFNTSYNKIIDVKTENKEGELRIYITPEHGAIDPRDFSFIPAKFKFDLAVVIGSPDKESVGKIYEENPDIFYEVPLVNIDYHSNNENFGQINLVNITSSSASEILFEFFKQINFSIDEKIANCLLTGIISATKSFQKKNTTPKALQIAAELIDKGADQQQIIRYLYKTQPFHLLKLWGRIMARLKWDEELELVWTPVYLEDFVQSRSSSHDIPFVLEKLKENYSTGKMFLVFFNETPDSVKGMIKFSNGDEMKKAQALWKGEWKGDVYEFKAESDNILKAEEEILGKLKSAIKQ